MDRNCIVSIAEVVDAALNGLPPYVMLGLHFGGLFWLIPFLPTSLVWLFKPTWAKRVSFAWLTLSSAYLFLFFAASAPGYFAIPIGVRSWIGIVDRYGLIAFTLAICTWAPLVVAWIGGARVGQWLAAVLFCLTLAIVGFALDTIQNSADHQLFGYAANMSKRLMIGFCR